MSLSVMLSWILAVIFSGTWCYSRIMIKMCVFFCCMTTAVSGGTFNDHDISEVRVDV